MRQGAAYKDTTWLTKKPAVRPRYRKATKEAIPQVSKVVSAVNKVTILDLEYPVSVHNTDYTLHIIHYTLHLMSTYYSTCDLSPTCWIAAVSADQGSKTSYLVA